MPIDIETEPETLCARDLLSKYHHIQIPDYQRHYTWGDENVAQFFEDLIHDVRKFHPALGHQRTSVFGTIIGMLELRDGLKDSDRHRDYIFTIIDGQQRISTLNILIACLTHFTKKYSKDFPSLAYSLGAMRKYLVKDGSMSNPIPRLIFNYNDKEYWDQFIDLFYSSDSECEGNLNKVRKKMKTFLDMQQGDTKLHAAIGSMYTNVDRYLAKANNPEKIIMNLWEWIDSPEDFGLRFTKIVEDDIHTALMRFDRENNRGVRVTMDDLAKSYLIEAVERTKLSDEIKKTKKYKILESWKEFQANSAGLSKEKIIQWFLIGRTGYYAIGGPDSGDGRLLMSRIFRDNLDIDPLKQEYSADENRSWDPVEIAAEIAHWVKTYQEIIKKREDNEYVPLQPSTYYNIMFLKELKAPWPFIVSLSIACRKDTPWNFETSKICGLPMQLMAELEYNVITQIMTKSYEQNDWEVKYRRWAGWLGRCYYKLTFDDVKKQSTRRLIDKEGPYFEDKEHLIDSFIEKISEDMHEFNTKLIGTDYYKFDDFLNRYNIQAEGGALTTQFASEKRAAHVRILKQTEYFLSKEKVSNILDNKKKGVELEHIFPKSQVNWKKDTDYSSEDVQSLVLLLHHLGNHTLVSEKFNKVLGNKKFLEKRYGKLASNSEKATVECYANSGLKITKSIANPDVTKWTAGKIYERGEILLRIWGMHSAKRISKTVAKVTSDEAKIFTPLDNPELKGIYALLNGEESRDLEFKAGYFNEETRVASPNYGEIDTKKISLLLCRVNATINAFANTVGGDLIIGKQDSSVSSHDMCGINSVIEYYEKKAVKKGEEKSNGREDFINDLSGSIRSFYPSEKYPIKYHAKLYDINGTYIVHINVEKFKKGPVPFHTPNSHGSQLYYLRHAAQNVVYDFNDAKEYKKYSGNEEYEPRVKELVFDTHYNEIGGMDVTIGPFKSKNTAESFRKNLLKNGKIVEYNIPPRSAIKRTLFKQKPNYMDYCNSMYKTVEYVDVDGKRACFICHLKNLPKDWTIEDGSETDLFVKKQVAEESVIEKNQKFEIKVLIDRLCKKKKNNEFTRSEFLDEYLNHLEKKWPNQKNPEQTVSRIFQELRDEGFIEFIEKGVYRLIGSL